jgi:CBS domain-containing protein
VPNDAAMSSIKIASKDGNSGGFSYSIFGSRSIIVAFTKLYTPVLRICKVMTTVKDFMTTNVVTIDVHETVLYAAKLMHQQDVGDLVVVEGKLPKGIVTERDLVRRVMAQKKPLDTQVSGIMSAPLITIEKDASIRDAARQMVKYKIRRLPVTNGSELVGIIAASDFARHIGKKTLSEEILAAMTRYPFAEAKR